MAKEHSIIPLEEEEQIAFVQWCRLNKIIVHHCANEIGGSSRAVKIRAIKAKQMGTSKGFPDLLVFIPVPDVLGDLGCYQMIAIEMKRIKNSTTSKEQKEWLKRLELSGIPARVCHGCDEAIAFCKEFMIQ